MCHCKRNRRDELAYSAEPYMGIISYQNPGRGHFTCTHKQLHHPPRSVCTHTPSTHARLQTLERIYKHRGVTPFHLSTYRLTQSGSICSKRSGLARGAATMRSFQAFLMACVVACSAHVHAQLVPSALKWVQQGGGQTCAFRQTGLCNGDGPREPKGDRGCADEIPCTAGACPSGYCECADGSKVHKVGCRLVGHIMPFSVHVCICVHENDETRVYMYTCARK